MRGLYRPKNSNSGTPAIVNGLVEDKIAPKTMDIVVDFWGFHKRIEVHKPLMCLAIAWGYFLKGILQALGPFLDVDGPLVSLETFFHWHEARGWSVIFWEYMTKKNQEESFITTHHVGDSHTNHQLE